MNQNGFGQAGTADGPELFVFGQKLYAYARDNEYGLFRMQSAVDRVWEGLFTPVNTASFQPFGSYLYAYDVLNQKLWWIKEGDSFISGNWKQVTSNGLLGGVSPSPGTVFNSRLYGVYYTSSGTFEIWRTAGIGDTVMNWERVVWKSFDDASNNMGVDIMAVFNNHIYAGTTTLKGMFGDYNSYGDGVEIWESSSGDFGTWTQVNYDGFGTEVTIDIVNYRTNQNIGSWVVYKPPNQQQEYLYIGTMAHFGAQIWRYDGTGKSGWTDVSPSWAGPALFGAQTYRFQDMVVFQGSLYVAEGRPSATLDKYDGTYWSIEVGGGDPPEPPFAPQNLGVVSLAVLENKLYVGPLTKEGSVGDQVWGYPFNILPGKFSSTPALACDGYETYMVVRGTNNGIYYMRTNYMDGGEWSGTWTKIPGETCDEPALAIMGDLHLVVRGMNNGIYHKTMNLNTGVWSDWASLGGSTLSAPTLIVSAYNRLALVVRGSDNGIYYNSYVYVPSGYSYWTGWTKIPGGTIDKPALASGGGILTLAVRGKDNGIYVNTMDLSSGVWGGWLHFSGTTPSAPAVDSGFYEGEFSLFVRGMDNKIYYTGTDQSGEWSGPWFTLPGATIDRPILAKTSIPTEVSHVVVRGADNGIYHSMFDTGGWSGWTKIAGTTTTCPGLTEYYYVGLELVYQDPSRIWYDYWDSWGGW